MPRASAPLALLALREHSGSEVARKAGYSTSSVSRMLTGHQPWNLDIAKALIEVTGDRTFVAELKGMAHQRRLDLQAEKRAARVEAMEAKRASQTTEVGS